MAYAQDPQTVLFPSPANVHFPAGHAMECLYNTTGGFRTDGPHCGAAGPSRLTGLVV